MKTVAVPPQPKSRPRFILPAGACNAHVHAVGAPGQFPQSPDRPYSTGGAPASELMAMQSALGLERVVIVNSIVYRNDNTYLLYAIAEIGTAARGIALIAPDASESYLADLERGGVRGVRLILNKSFDASELERTADRIRGLGWHIQVYGDLDIVAALCGRFAGLNVPVVVDHFGGALAAAGVDQPGFSALLDALGSGNVYVKLSGLHRCSPNPPHADVLPLARALISVRPDRLLWGNDWPHPAAGLSQTVNPGPHIQVEWSDVDDGSDLNLLGDWMPDAEVRRMILVDNPAQLYRF